MNKNNDAVQKVITPISSLQGRPSHYCLQKSSKIYLPEELDIINYIKCTQKKNPEYPVSYEFYRNNFRPSLILPLGIPDQTLALSVMSSNQTSNLFLQGSLMIVEQQKK